MIFGEPLEREIITKVDWRVIKKIPSGIITDYYSYGVLLSFDIERVYTMVVFSTKLRCGYMRRDDGFW